MQFDKVDRTDLICYPTRCICSRCSPVTLKGPQLHIDWSLQRGFTSQFIYPISSILTCKIIIWIAKSLLILPQMITSCNKRIAAVPWLIFPEESTICSNCPILSVLQWSVKSQHVNCKKISSAFKSDVKQMLTSCNKRITAAAFSQEMLPAWQQQQKQFRWAP